MQRMVFLFAFLCLLVRCAFAQTAVTSVSNSFTIGATLVLAAADTSISSSASVSNAAHEVDDQTSTSLQSIPTTPASSHPQTTHIADNDGHKRPGTPLPNLSMDSSSHSTHHPTVYRTPPMPPFPYPTNPLANPPHGRPHHPIAPPTSPPSTSPSSPSHRKHKQPVVAIVFEVLAGVAGSFLIFMLSRCAYSWRRTPQRDRVQSLLSRHYLEREMVERERWEVEQRVLQAAPNLWRPPPPPYVTAPAYEEVVGQGDAAHAV